MKTPYITLKFAQTLDGRIAAKDGSSKWISSFPARKFVHKLRAKSDAVLVGIGTILKDNPSLTTRLVKGKNPTRIVIDGKLRTPPSANVVKTAKKIKTIIVTTRKASQGKIKQLKKKGVEVIISTPAGSGNIDLKKVTRVLYKKGIKSILAEGGRGIATAFLRSGLVSKVIVIIAPKILGKGVEAIADLGITGIKGALKLRLKSVEKLGDDIIFTASL